MSTGRASDVLATMRDDGSRRWLRPKLSRGGYLTRRRVVGYPLIALFVALPFVRVDGRPGLRIDIGNRELDLVGAVFHATDTVLLMLFLVAALLAVFLLTAVAGRVWCGYACPQSVYMELVYRPLERLIEGKGHSRGNVGVPRFIAKTAAFAVLSVFLGNVFVAYFVGTDALAHWVHGSPMAALGPFIAMAVTSTLVFADFAWFREQMCTVACPYARLQSALTDSETMLVRYDAARGEPRGKVRARLPIVGDCIDCKACVATCPTGIDIRNGTQLECIGCAQCADACDAIMDKLGRARGLVGYAKPTWRTVLARPRVVVYAAIIATLVCALIALARRDRSLEITLLATSGAPYVVMPDGRVGNTLRLKLVNQHSERRMLIVAMAEADHALVLADNPVLLAPRETRTLNLLVTSAPGSFVSGLSRAHLTVEEAGHAPSVVTVALAGPFQGAQP